MVVDCDFVTVILSSTVYRLVGMSGLVDMQLPRYGLGDEYFIVNNTSIVSYAGIILVSMLFSCCGLV